MDPITISIPEAAALLGVCSKRMYQIANEEGFPAVKLGGRKLVYVDGLKTWIRRMAESGAQI